MKLNPGMTFSLFFKLRSHCIFDSSFTSHTAKGWLHDSIIFIMHERCPLLAWTAPSSNALALIDLRLLLCSSFKKYLCHMKAYYVYM